MRTFLLFVIVNVVFLQYSFAAEQYDYIVAKDGSANFTKIQAAIDACKAFPDKSITIFVRNGVYNEKIVVPSCNTKLSIKGESVEKTIITYNDFFDKINRGRNSTFYTYTFLIQATDFRLENITIENSAGAVGQAVALHVEADRCIFVNCSILGNQDTLYLTGEKSRHFFKDCYIEGTTDFIFGEATAFFSYCSINSKSNSYITAASTNKNKAYGFVFDHCNLTASHGVDEVFLGRPWRDYAKVVFLNCNFGAHVLHAGWANWDGTQRDKTAYYAEYKNTGLGADVAKRADWSVELNARQARKYSIKKVLKAHDNWCPVEN